MRAGQRFRFCLELPGGRHSWLDLKLETILSHYGDARDNDLLREILPLLTRHKLFLHGLLGCVDFFPLPCLIVLTILGERGRV